MTGELQTGMDLKGERYGQIVILFWNLPGGTKKNHKKP
jgi:hypothetical protein